jgi:hypothetical protein
MATCNIRITRGTTKDAHGERTAQGTVVYARTAASITERSNQYFDFATQTPRTVRSLEMLVSSSLDVRPGDRVEDLNFGAKYVVEDVTQSTGPLFIPDKVCGLKKVG